MTVSEKSESHPVGKWIAGIAASVIVAVLGWWLTHDGGLLNPKPEVVVAPHAPAVEVADGPLYDEQVMVLHIAAGGSETVDVMGLWSGPEGLVPSCANGFLAFSWIVRSPYPDGDDDLEIRHLIPRGDGRTEQLASGATGSATIGYCDELTFVNTATEEYQVEVRFASGVFE